MGIVCKKKHTIYKLSDSWCSTLFLITYEELIFIRPRYFRIFLLMWILYCLCWTGSRTSANDLTAFCWRPAARCVFLPKRRLLAWKAPRLCRGIQTLRGTRWVCCLIPGQFKYAVLMFLRWNQGGAVEVLRFLERVLVTVLTTGSFLFSFNLDIWFLKHREFPSRIYDRFIKTCCWFLIAIHSCFCLEHSI